MNLINKKMILTFVLVFTFAINDINTQQLTTPSKVQKTALVCGAGGFIGSHLVKRLKKEGFWVRGVDLKYPEFGSSAADDFVIGDLRNPFICEAIVKVAGKGVDQVYQLAADMGGMGYIAFHDADIMHNSAAININMVEACRNANVQRVFYSSSACIYPEYNQLDPQNPKCSEDSVYPAQPDTEYGWEKLFSERIYKAYSRDYGLTVRIARFHNIFGIKGTWCGGREKAPAALCRKVANAQEGDTIEVWGKGDQTRSFLYIDECVEGIRRLMESDCEEVLNIGSEEMIAINDLAKMIISLSGKNLMLKNIDGPEGVRGRNSDNRLISKKLAWAPSKKLVEGMKKTYSWINRQVISQKKLVA